MPKILIFANNDVGLYKFRKELIKELLKDSEIVISLPNGELVQPLIDMGCIFINTDVDRRGINPLADFQLIRNYFKILKSVRPDIVITYTIKPNIYGGIVSRMRKVSYAINITGLGTTFQKDGLLKKFIIFLYKISCKNARIVFFENKKNQEVFISNRIIVSEKAFKLNGAGVNLNEYQFKPYPKNDKRIRFLFIGRLMKEKGIYELLEVAEKVKARNNNIQFDIIGPIEDDINSKLEQLQDSGIVNFYGYQKDVRPFIEKAHCFVLPSYHEGMANTLLESAAMGRPLIASDIPGCREAILDGESGYVIQVRNAEDLYSKVTKFINLTYEDKKKMAERSRKHIQTTFDKSKVVKQTINVLKKKCNIDWRDNNEENTAFTI